jgi:hypothetical protein
MGLGRRSRLAPQGTETSRQLLPTPEVVDPGCQRADYGRTGYSPELTA